VCSRVRCGVNGSTLAWLEVWWGVSKKLRARATARGEGARRKRKMTPGGAALGVLIAVSRPASPQWEEGGGGGG